MTELRFQLQGDLPCSRQGADTGERYVFAVQLQQHGDEHLFTVQVTNWQVPAWTTQVKLQGIDSINKMLKDQGAPAKSLENVLQWMTAAMQHQDARVMMEDGTMYIRGLFAYGNKSDWKLRLPPKGSLQALDEQKSHELIDEVSRRLITELRNATQGLAEVRQQLLRERCDSQAALSARDDKIAKLADECRQLKERMGHFEGRAATGRDRGDRAGSGAMKRQRTGDSGRAMSTDFSQPQPQGSLQLAGASQLQSQMPGATQALQAAIAAVAPAASPLKELPPSPSQQQQQQQVMGSPLGASSQGFQAALASPFKNLQSPGGGVSVAGGGLGAPAYTFFGVSQQASLAAPSVAGGGGSVAGGGGRAGAEGGNEEVLSGSQQNGGHGLKGQASMAGGMEVATGPKVVPATAGRGLGRGRGMARGRGGGTNLRGRA